MIERIVTPPLGANAFLIYDEKKAIVDPGGDSEFIINVLKRKNLLNDLDYIILTHTHFDHALATSDLKRVTSADILIHEKEYEFFKTSGFQQTLFGVTFPVFEADKLLKEKDFINLGELKLEVIHTPGHTPGSICLYDEIKEVIFTGDTVFPNGGFGRVDFPGGSAYDLLNSLKRLSEIEAKLMYPGHDEPVDNASEHLKLAYRMAKMFL